MFSRSDHTKGKLNIFLLFHRYSVIGYRKMVLHWEPFEEPSQSGWNWRGFVFAGVIVRHKAEEFKHIENRECQKINSMSRSDLCQYARNVTKDNWRFFGVLLPFGSLRNLENLFYRASTYEYAHRSAPEAIVKTVKSILACIKSRLEGKCFL